VNILAKLNIIEIKQYKHALSLRSDNLKALYQEIESGILSEADIQEQVDMNKKQILTLHKKMYNYWQGKNGKWYSYLPKEGVAPPKGKQIESISDVILV
jgi:hypothetical protein